MSSSTGKKTSPPLIAAAGLSLALAGRRVLDHVDLTVHTGEIVTVIGPNGSGKSTLVKVLLGLIRPDSGHVRRRPGLRVGYLPQKFHLDRNIPLTVARLITLTRPAGRDSIVAALAETGIAHLVDAAAAGLSGGEMQRALLARAILRDPDLLVLDEPVQGVDYAGEARLYQLIGDIRDRRGCGILMVSHDLHIVMGGSDKVVCLNTHVCCAGVPESVARHDEYKRLFGDFAGHYALYTHHHDHAHDSAGQIVPAGKGSPADAG